MTEQLVADFAGLLRLLRERALLTQEELAGAAGLSPRSVSDLERGIHRTARKDTAVLLAGALGLSEPARELFVAAARGRAPAADVLAAGSGLPGAAGVPGPGAGAAGDPAGSPYRGLKAFGEQDAGLFFGREAATTAVAGRMAALLTGPGVLVVSGASGAGKSSLLAAGVLPRLRAAGLAEEPGAAWWPQVVFTPTRAPLDELAVQVAALTGADAAGVARELAAHPEGFALTARQAATARPRELAGAPMAGRNQQQRLVLVVDQFEELFTQCDQEAQRRAFITALHAAATTSHGPGQTPAALVVLGVRADFETRCADYPLLAGPVQDRYLVTAMTERQLRLAITEPAKTAGSAVDDDLVAVLLAEVANGQPGTTGAGALPLLSHALDQAWRHRAGDTVTLADYERTGGIEGAVAASAQRAYNTLTPAQQAAAQQVFTRLAAVSSDGIDTADRATRADLTTGKTPAETADVEQVLEAFAAERLLTLSAGTVELSHEILLTAWPLLRDTWLADTHADRIARTRLRTTAAEWDHHHRDPSYLYTGTLLQAAAGTAARITADPARHPPLSQTERDFLHASDRAHHRRARRRQGLLAVLVALVIGLASVTVLTVRARQQAVAERNVAISRQLISQSQQLGDTNPVLSKLLSVAAWRIHHSDDARYAMLQAATLPEIAVLAGHTGPVTSVAFSPDGTTLASGSEDSTIRLWDVASRHQIGRPLSGFTGPVNSIAFSPDGATLASGGEAGMALWNMATHRADKNPPSRSTDYGPPVAFSHDGKTLAAVNGSNFTIGLWKVATGQRIGRPLSGHGGQINSVAFSPKGQILAVGADPGNPSGSCRGKLHRGAPIVLWYGATHRETAICGIPSVWSVAFSPNGQILASGSEDGTVRLWEVATGHQIGSPLTGGAGTVNSVAFSPNGQILASGSEDGTVRLLDVATGHQIGSPLTGGSGSVNSVAFSPNGQILASGSADDTVRLWNVATGPQIGMPLASHSQWVNSVVFSPDGKTLASANSNGLIRLWNMVTRRRAGNLTSPVSQPPLAVAFSPDGNTLASAHNDSIELWDVASGHQRSRPLTGHLGLVYALAFSPDGNTLASGSVEGLQLWNMAAHPQPSEHSIESGTTADLIAISPGGETLAADYAGNAVQLWNMATRSPSGSLPVTGAVSIAFSPDNKTVATADLTAVVRLWNVATRRQIGPPLPVEADSVTFSPNGKTLATANSADETIQLWDLVTRQLIGTLPAGPVTSVAFSPKGATLAGGNGDGAVPLWNVDYLDNIVPYLCASAGRSLTPAEWAKYIQSGPAYYNICP
jgi:WD40 repeat protein/transcriptional regulator with XRE-family HTH domain